MHGLFLTDSHNRNDIPVSRKETTEEEWLATQIDSWKQMFEYASKHDITDVFHGGDVFNGWQTSNTARLLYELIKLCMKYSEIKVHVCVGNHDLPNHRLDLVEKSNLGILQASGCVIIEDRAWFSSGVEVDYFHYTEPLDPRIKGDMSTKFRVAIIHDYIFEKVIPPHFDHAYTVEQLLDKLPDYDLYLCGHNHEKFISTINDKTVINGGSFGRTKRTQGKHRTTFWDIDTNTKIYKPIEIKEDLDMLDTTKKGKSNTEVFVETTKDFTGESFNFKKYVEDCLINEKIEEEISTIVYECIGD